MTTEWPAGDWITARHAADILGVGGSYLHQHSGVFQRAIATRTRTGKSARGAGRLWRRQDVESIAEISRVCDLRPIEAARVYAAQRAGDIPPQETA